jgi:hypothetical protein
MSLMTPDKKTYGWVIFIAAVGMMASMVAVDISALMGWGEAVKPVFVGTVIGHLGAVIAAFVGGKIIPEDRNPTERTRADDVPKETGTNNPQGN